jgi:hypothetical protein
MPHETDFTSICCKLCNQPLIGPSGADYAEMDELVSCRTHGPVGTLPDVLAAAGEQVLRQAGDHFADAIGKLGFNVKHG